MELKNDNEQKSTHQIMSQAQQKHIEDPQKQSSIDDKFSTLCSMFKAVDRDVIRLVLIEECDGNVESAVEALLVVSGGVSHSQQQDEKEEKVKAKNDDISNGTNCPNEDISNAILIIDDLWQHSKSERGRTIQILSIIYEKIKLNPNEAKYRRLDLSKTLSKPGFLPHFVQLLLCSGFTAHANGIHFDLYDNKLNLCSAVGQIFEERVNGFDDCAKRIVECFQLQKLGLSDEDFYDLVCSKYPNEDVTHFLNDYHQFIKNMNTNRLYLRRSAVCSKQDCPLIKRQNRYKRRENGDRKSMIGQRLRQIHILCHQYDEEQRIKNDKDYRQQIIKEKTECEDDEKETQNNKFVTDIKANNGKYLKYSFGFQFYYHPFYKDLDERGLGKEFYYEQVTNLKGQFKDWYVSPKYKDLKEEIVGKFLTIQQFENEMKKAMKNINSIEGKKLRANNEYETRFGVKAGSAISIDDMLCVMLYTNYDKLQNKFSKTFRKASQNESDEELKERHSAFVHLSRFIKEAVNCFGDNKSKITVYHGINSLTIFDNFTIRFSGPTSTTTSWGVAINFATNSGTVITMQSVQYQYASHHFDCALWSDFPAEDEELFIGMDFAMDIVNVHDIHENIEYEEWTNVIRVSSKILIERVFLPYPITQFVEEKLRLLIEAVTNESVKGIPEYIVDTFNHIRMDATTLHIDINKYSNDVVWKQKNGPTVLYGSKKFKNVYFDKNDNIKWQFIKLLFPKLSRVVIMNNVLDAENPNITSFSNAESILLTDDLLKEMFDFLKDTDIDWIGFYQPQNNVNSMKELKARFDAQYEKIGYALNLKENFETKDPRAQGQLNIFEIIRISKYGISI